MWTYRQSSGELLRDGRFIAQGYSGYGTGKNVPAAQTTADVGPIPAGAWRIDSLIPATREHGPFVLVLLPCAGTPTFGRSGFLMHADSLPHPGKASRGCIIMPRFAREMVWSSHDRALTVTI